LDAAFLGRHVVWRRGDSTRGAARSASLTQARARPAMIRRGIWRDPAYRLPYACAPLTRPWQGRRRSAPRLARPFAGLGRPAPHLGRPWRPIATPAQCLTTPAKRRARPLAASRDMRQASRQRLETSDERRASPAEMSRSLRDGPCV